MRRHDAVAPLADICTAAYIIKQHHNFDEDGRFLEATDDRVVAGNAGLEPDVDTAFYRDDFATKFRCRRRSIRRSVLHHVRCRYQSRSGGWARPIDPDQGRA